MRWSSLILLAAFACKPEPQDSPDPGGGTPAGTTTGSPTTGSTTETDSTVPVPEFDCSTVSATPLSWQELDTPRGYHDLAFTEDGWIIGNDDWNQRLVMADGYGGTDVFLDGTGMVQGLEWLPDGNLAVATSNSGAILRVDPVTRDFSVLVPGVYAYGIIMGPDGKLWSANNNIVQRHDVNTGASETVLWSTPSGSPRVINFNRDYTKLYIGTNFGNGSIYQVDLDAQFNPISGATVLATGVGDGNYHDGMGVDICGYIYVPDYGSSAMYRITPSGQVSTLYDVQLGQYGHGLEWGNGTGPWREDALYTPLPYGGNRVIEIVIGVPRVFEGNVINAPQP